MGSRTIAATSTRLPYTANVCPLVRADEVSLGAVAVALAGVFLQSGGPAGLQRNSPVAGQGAVAFERSTRTGGIGVHRRERPDGAYRRIPGRCAVAQAHR